MRQSGPVGGEMARVQGPSLDVVAGALGDAGRSRDPRQYRSERMGAVRRAFVAVPAAEDVEAADEPPLIVELDGLLLKSNVVIETFFFLLGRQPVRALRVLAM